MLNVILIIHSWIISENHKKQLSIDTIKGSLKVLTYLPTGFYRVNYDFSNWQKLIRYLKSYNYTKIHPINRAQLIDDSYHLMLAGHVNSSVFFEIISYLKQESDYIPWYPMEAIFSNMSIFFEMPESTPVKVSNNISLID